MIKFIVEDNSNKLDIIIGGPNFHELIEQLKFLGAQFIPASKSWQVSLARFTEIKEELSYFGEPCEIDTFSQKNIDKYLNSLQELKTAIQRRPYRPELLNYQPLEGKPPFENYQKQDVLKALQYNRQLFMWDVGLGKSWATACLIEHGWHYNMFDKILLFSSTIGVWNLKQELLKFMTSVSSEDIEVFMSVEKLKYDDRGIFTNGKHPAKIFIMTYDTLKSISNYYYDQANAPKRKKVLAKGEKPPPRPSQKTKKYKKSCIPWEQWTDKPMGLFLDECHLLGNPSSRRSEIFMQNISNFDHRYLFSATPADAYQKLYNITYMLDKNLVNGLSYMDWLKQHNELGNRWSRFAINQDKWRLDKIADLNKQLLENYATKRKRADVLDLPMAYEHPTFNLEMGPKQRKIYELVITETVQAAQRALRDPEKVASSLLNKFQFLQQAIDNPTMLNESKAFSEFSPELQKEISTFDMQKHFLKFAIIDDILLEKIDEEDKKGIIWYFHPATLEELLQRYKKYNPLVISRDVPKEERMKIVNEFQNSDKHRLIILSIICANTSITLTSCNWELYAEKTYNYTDYYQSRGRINRPGQTEATTTFTLCYDNSIDWLQQKALDSKGKVINSLANKDFIDGSLWKNIYNASDNFSLDNF